MEDNSKPTKIEKTVMEQKETNGIKDRGEARRMYWEDEKIGNKDMEMKKNKKSEDTDEKKKETPKMDDGNVDEKKKKESFASDATKKMEEVKLEKKNINETRRSKMAVLPLDEVADEQQYPAISSNVNQTPRGRKTRKSSFDSPKNVKNARASLNVTPRKSIITKRESMAQGRKRVSFMPEAEENNDPVPEILNKANYEKDREMDERMKRLSTKFERNPSESTHPLTALPTGELLRSTNIYTGKSSAGSQKLEVYTKANGAKWMVRVMGKKIELLKLENGQFMLKHSNDAMEQLKCKPLALHFLHDQLKRNILFVLSSENRMLLFEFIDGKLECFYNEQYPKKKTDKLLKSVVMSFEPESATLAFSNQMESVTFLCVGGKDKVKTKTLRHDSRNMLNILVKKTEVDEKLEVLTQSRLMFDGGKDVQMEKFSFDSKTLTRSDFVPCKNVQTLGHLVAVPSPFFGHFILGQNLISYQMDFDSKLSEVKGFRYKSFGMLSPKKMLILIKEGAMFLCNLVVEGKENFNVHSIHLEKIDMIENVKNFVILDEFQLLITKDDIHWEYFKLKRKRPTTEYQLIQIAKAEEEKEITSPPFIWNGHAPKAQPKKQMLQEGDELNGKWLIINKIGRGGFGLVFLAKDKQDKTNNAIVAVKIQQKFCEAEINRELHFLKLIRTKKISGFPRLLDTCDWFDKWICLVMTFEGQSLNALLKKSTIFNQHNCMWIFQKLVKIVGSMTKLGYVHLDLHKKNVLLKKANKQLKMCIIDFGSTQKIGQYTIGEQTVENTNCYDLVECVKIVKDCAGENYEEEKWLKDAKKVIKENRMNKTDPLPTLNKMLEKLAVGEAQFVDKDGNNFKLL